MEKLTPDIICRRFNIIRRCYQLVRFHEMFVTHLTAYLVLSLIVRALDPDIEGLSDALRFTFQTGATIGYGGPIVNDSFARFLTVLSSTCSMVVVALFTGILAGYFVDAVKSEARESATRFLLDLEKLPEMIHEEL